MQAQTQPSVQRRSERAISLVENVPALALHLGRVGAYIKGGGVDTWTGARLYGRFAMVFGNDYILGGRAFRHFATLPELSIRQLVQYIPEKPWNFEP